MEGRYDFEKQYRGQILQCSRCGFCQAVCPLYGATLRPAYNARGKMLLLREVMEGRIDLGDELVETLFQCTTCGGCLHTCPSGVRVPDIIKQARKDMAGIGSCHPVFKAMNGILDKYANIYAEDGPEDFGRERGRRAKAVFFIGCVGSYREEEATRATLNLLDRMKTDYSLIDEVCCSGVLDDVGHGIKEDLANRNMERILKTGAKTVITGCPYCFRTFSGRPQYGRLRDEGVTVIPISRFLSDMDFGVKTDKRVTYHDPCDLGRHSGIYEEPRRTIRKIAPNFVEMRYHGADALCCGAGGGVRGAFAGNSIAMARKRLEEVEDIGAEVVLTECHSCVHNLENARLRRQKFRVCTTTQFIDELMEAAKQDARRGANETGNGSTKAPRGV